jgi:hypothetical protein
MRESSNGALALDAGRGASAGFGGRMRIDYVCIYVSVGDPAIDNETIASIKIINHKFETRSGTVSNARLAIEAFMSYANISTLVNTTIIAKNIHDSYWRFLTNSTTPDLN